MHLGGIGTGNVEIGCDGRFTHWQLFNTLRDGQVSLLFAIKAGPTTRLLQTVGGPGWPRVKQIEMTGEYPIATLRYLDPELPVKLELTAFTPFAPLDTRFSSQPLAAIVFRLHNRTPKAQRVSLAALMQNPVGYDATGTIQDLKHPCVGGNVNEPWQDGLAKGLLMRAAPGKERRSIERSRSTVIIYLNISCCCRVNVPRICRWVCLASRRRSFRRKTASRWASLPTAPSCPMNWRIPPPAFCGMKTRRPTFPSNPCRRRRNRWKREQHSYSPASARHA